MKRSHLTTAGLSVAALLLAFGPAMAQTSTGGTGASGSMKGDVTTDQPSASPGASGAVKGDINGDVKTDTPSASPRTDDQQTGSPRRAPEQQEK